MRNANEVLKKFKVKIRKLYGERLRNIILLWFLGTESSYRRF